MKNEIEEAKNNFPGGIIPSKFLQFYEFAVKNSACDLFNYESISNGKYFLSNLLTDKVINNFVPFYVDGAHAIFSVWIVDGNKSLESIPIVYIDTEANYRVCASNFDEFVFLFSRAIVVQLSRLMVKYIASIEDGSYCLNPFEEFSAGNLKEMEAENKKQYKCYNKFKTYVAEQMGIKFEGDPVKLVENAIRNNPNLLDYLRENDGLKIPT